MSELGQLTPLNLLLIVLIVWSLIWKGIALSKAAHHDQLGWYLAILILNTAGILDITYIWFFQKKKG